MTPHILIFDSGIGGMSVYAEIAKALPHAKFSYLADDAVFPYGALSEDALIARVMELMGDYIPKLTPGVVVIACNTASTLVLPHLRARFNMPFVGTVPAIKPASERSKSKMFSVLATPGTVARDYTKELIRLHASDCDVSLVGAPNLAKIAEEYLMQNTTGRNYSLLPLRENVLKERMRGNNTTSNFKLYFTKENITQTFPLPSPPAEETCLTLPSNLPEEDVSKKQTRDNLLTQIRVEILPTFIEKNNTRTDIIVLACTHYPLILSLLQQVAPWKVEWINPAEAIARRVKSLTEKDKIKLESKLV